MCHNAVKPGRGAVVAAERADEPACTGDVRRRSATIGDNRRQSAKIGDGRRRWATSQHAPATIGDGRRRSVTVGDEPACTGDDRRREVAERVAAAGGAVSPATLSVVIESRRRHDVSTRHAAVADAGDDDGDVDARRSRSTSDDERRRQ